MALFGSHPSIGGPGQRPAVSDDQVLDELTRMARSHPERGLLQFGGWIGSRQYRRLYRLVREHTKPDALVLDWGTGNGHFSYYLQRVCRRAIGYSLLEAPFREWLPDPAGYEFHRGDGSDPIGLPFEDAAFDAVASIGVLEHVRETGGEERASLREIARVLRPGGVFLCYHFPNRWSLIDAAARRVPGLHHHEYRYTKRDIVDLTASAGLALESVARYGMLPRNFSARLPAWLAGSRALAVIWDFADAALAVPFAALCQNYCFVARKLAGTSSPRGTAAGRGAHGKEPSANEPTESVIRA